MSEHLVTTSLEILHFEVGGQHYGLPLSDVGELVRAVSITALPRAPAIIEGVINLRGSVVPVLDFRARFRLTPRPVELTDHFIVARAGQRQVAIRADRAVGLIALRPEALQDARQVAPGAGYISAIARLEDGLILIHDLETFLSSAEATELDSALEQAGAEGADA